MSFASVECPHCGTSLEMEAGATTFPCPHCAQPIALETEGTSKKREALAQLNREWAQDEGRYLRYVRSSGMTGAYREPSKEDVILSGGIAIVSAIALLIWMPRAAGLEWLIYLIAVVLIAAGLYGIKAGLKRVKKFQQAKANYELRKREIEAEFGSAS
jgi:hypothetical protein